jgi:hypothetical protein
LEIKLCIVKGYSIAFLEEFSLFGDCMSLKLLADLFVELSFYGLNDFIELIDLPVYCFKGIV